jgi:NAD(P)H-dependent FMN reductase
MRVLALCGSLRAASMNMALLRATGVNTEAIVAAHAEPIRAALSALAGAAA